MRICVICGKEVSCPYFPEDGEVFHAKCGINQMEHSKEKCKEKIPEIMDKIEK